MIDSLFLVSNHEASTKYQVSISGSHFQWTALIIVQSTYPVLFLFKEEYGIKESLRAFSGEVRSNVPPYNALFRHQTALDGDYSAIKSSMMVQALLATEEPGPKMAATPAL